MQETSLTDFVRPKRLEGQTVVLEEIEPKYFPFIIKWRNDPELTKFLNQPYKLTLEKERSWYERKYLPDKTQGFYLLIDKASGTPFGTIGYTDLDLSERICVMGRLLVGDEAFRGSVPFMEHSLVLSDWVYRHADMVYIHVAKGNTAALRFNGRFGFRPHEGRTRFPEELARNGLTQVEMCRSKEEYGQVREKFSRRIRAAAEALQG